MLSAEDHARLGRRVRELLRAEDFSEDDLVAIGAAHVPEEYACLDAELEGWKD